LRFNRILHFVLLAAIVMYVVVGEIARPQQQPLFPVLYSSLAVLGCVLAAIAFLVRSRMLRPANDALQVDAEDGRALARWTVGNLISFSLALAIALLGLVLRMGWGYPLREVAPFYAAGALLMLFFTPRLP
jgi:hypothetical protein